ncbi:hsp90-like protein [Fomitiporia mediterranea MF3/22]|uniref:hsp90-like protein n=1 Tax=Fomitiporia mediterranea (strain MF3/22) TaxID=694068 RepID=UPI00044087B4|nr:hsp90-like protein [Fomitiporia mediterranea MF3/22]EJC99020.1 hsp90-like protein [Fomitiporia mediterranea MF3/22]
MPLNYSKWDRLEISDDSDIEGHPNVDHRSLVNWKRRDIHEKRAQRNAKITSLKSNIAINDVLLPRLRSITEDVHNSSNTPAEFSRIVEQLRTSPSPLAPPPPDPAIFGPEAAKQRQVPYDEMILSLLMKVYEDAKEKGVAATDDRLAEVLVKNLKGHVARLGEEQERLKKELDGEEREKDKKITSEHLHDAWDSHYVPPTPEPKPVKGLSSKPKTTATETKTDFEVLNTKSVEQAQAASLASQNPPPPTSPTSTTTTPTGGNNADDDDDELPEMTPTLEEFSHLPLRGYEQSFHFIQSHREVYVPGASDALLIAAFQAERANNPTYAKQCVHQSLLLQYCEKLGPDGVRLFFKRMMSGDARADGVFSKDVEDTYEHVQKRVKAQREEERERGVDENGETEQIQLVVEGADGTTQNISFVIPDGPPPEHLQLEGPGTESLNIEEVRKALQMRWDVYNGFPEELKNALKSQKLEEVNKVLGKMKVSDAERVVGLLDSAGILNFAEGGIRDETGRSNSKEEEDDEGEDADVEGGPEESDDDEVDEEEDKDTKA